MTWVIIVILAMTGQKMALKQPSEEACLADLEKVRAGIYREITLDNGLRLPISGAIGCFNDVQLQAREGRGA